jgi:hypothetical protein
MAQEAEMTIIGMDDVLAVFLKAQLIGRNTRSPLARMFPLQKRDLYHENLQALGLSPQAFPSSAEVSKSARSRFSLTLLRSVMSRVKQRV